MAQAHDFWQHQFLHTAGLPATTQTVGFMWAWGNYEKAAHCDHNPIALSRREPGSTRCAKLPNGRYARNYTDTQSAANAFADQLNLTDYPDLRRALASGEPWSYPDASGVSLNLEKWGAVRFQAYYVESEHLQPAGSGNAPVPHSKNVGGAWSRLMRVLAQDGHRTIVELQRATASLNRIERRLRRA